MSVSYTHLDVYKRQVLDRLTRYKRLEQYPEDKELLGDVIVENQQAIEMTSISVSYTHLKSDRKSVGFHFTVESHVGGYGMAWCNCIQFSDLF